MIASSVPSVKALHRTGPAYADTFGPEVGSLCAQAGFTPDYEQQQALNALFGICTDGLAASFEFAIVGPRQNLKTGLLKMAAIGWLFVTEQELITWSAHEMSTTAEAFRDLKGLIEGYAPFRRRLATGPSGGIYEGNGKELIELATGQRIKFKARTKVGGRGLTGDKVILDEAMYLQASHLGSLLPTLAVVPDPQVAYAGSAGLLQSAEWRAIRDRGRPGGDPKLTYVEYGTAPGGCELENCDHRRDPRPPGCALDNEEKRREANPSYGGRLKPERLEDFRRSMPPDEFAREFLSWWDDPDETEQVFGIGRWAACGTGEEPPPASVIGLAVSIDLEWGSIAAGGRWADDRVHVGSVERRRGTQWLTAEAKRIQAERGCIVVMDERCPDASLLKDLREVEVNVRTVNLEQYIEACSELVKRVNAELITHSNTTELNDAIKCAAWRMVSDRKVWGRRQSSGDVSMLEAATLAAWVAKSSYNPLDSIR